jgi:hypothetical protein
MKRAALLVLVAVACRTPSFAQDAPIALTANITNLDGQWTLDPTASVLGDCGNGSNEFVRIGVSARGVSFESRRLTGLLSLDGSVTQIGGGNFSGAATATLDAGWLAVTIRRKRTRGTTGIERSVYVVSGDELTVRRTFVIELPDGSLSRNVCGNGNPRTLVYQRQRRP